MPELPEVEVVRRSLLPSVTDRRLGPVRVRERRLRAAVDVRTLSRGLPGRKVLNVRRRAKYLLFDLEGGAVLLMHLGMTGRLGVHPARRRLEKHDHFIVAMEGDVELRFNDARRFGLVELIPPGGEATHPRLRHLGLEPFGAGFTAAQLRRAARGHRLPVKNFLMDSRRVAGIGNIYASEALHDARIHPGRPAGRLSAARWERLVRSVRKVLRSSIAQGGTTMRDFASADGTPGYFALHLEVYDREGELCRRCRRPIRRVVQSGRGTFYCPSCQH